MTQRKPGMVFLARPAVPNAPEPLPVEMGSKPTPPAPTRPSRVKDPASVANAVESLRSGGPLDAQSIAAVADALSARFEVLRSAWAGKKYFSPASVFLSDDSEGPEDDNYVERYLAFRKQGKEWNFFIEEQHCRDQDGESFTSIPLTSAPLDVRLEAVDALEKLETELKAQRDSLRKRLVAALNGMDAYIERSLSAEKEG
jgi:hypothetical protein